MNIFPVCESFRVGYRNPGHWDIYENHGDRRRLYKIRGEPGNFSVQDEANKPYPVVEGFATVDAAMAYVCAKLMREREC